MPSSARLRAVPAWAWLVLVVAASVALRAALSRQLPGPFIFVDELIYSELAKSFAAGGHFLVRDTATSGYGVVYPALISPAYRLFDDLPQAYAAVKVINSLLMSLAAVPAYLLARRVVRPGLAVVVALLTVAVPSMAYTGTVMTENAFYPLFLFVALALVAALEDPAPRRQLVLLALVVVSYLTRAQSIAFVPAILSAPLLLGLIERRPLGVLLRRFGVLYWTTGIGALLVVAAQVARGRSISALLGAYSVVSDRSYDVREIADFALWHTADLALYVGVIPLAATIVVVARSRRESPQVQAFVAATVPLAVWFTLVVATFATNFADDRIHERNLFQLAPLLFVGLAVWATRHDGGARRGLLLTTLAVVAAAAVPLTIPFSRFVGEPARADTLALLPLWSINAHYLAGSAVLTVAVACAVLGGLMLIVPRGAAVALPVVVLAWFVLLVQPVFAGSHGFRQSSRGAVFQGIRGVDRDWIDHAVPKGARVAVLWSDRGDRLTVNENEFFNRSVGQIYYEVAPTPGGLYEKHVTFGRDGVARTDDGRLVTPRYLLTDGTASPDGTVVARDDLLDTTLWRLRGPLVQTTTVTGIYPDYWSGPRVTWTRRRCRGGTLAVSLYSDPNFYVPATVVATGGRARVSARVARLGITTLRVRLPAGTPTCVVRFAISPTRVPKVVTNGASSDDRALGTHFHAFAYRPAR